MPYSSLRPILSTSVEGIRRKKALLHITHHSLAEWRSTWQLLWNKKKVLFSYLSSSLLFPPRPCFYILYVSSESVRWFKIHAKESLCSKFSGGIDEILRPDRAEHSHSHSLLRLFAKCDNRDHTVQTAGSSSLLSSLIQCWILCPLSVCLMCACLLLSSCFSSTLWWKYSEAFWEIHFWFWLRMRCEAQFHLHVCALNMKLQPAVD